MGPQARASAAPPQGRARNGHRAACPVIRPGVRQLIDRTVRIAKELQLDCRDRPEGHVCTAEEIRAELDRIGYSLNPFDIVQMNTAAGAAYGGPDFLDRGCGLGREATLFLAEQGLKITGTDAWSWDAPFRYTRKRFERDHDPAIIGEGHKAGMERGYCHIEKLTNLDRLPDHGFKVSCFPVKIDRASAGWVRAVAHLPD